jgi:hypothetical protein
MPDLGLFSSPLAPRNPEEDPAFLAFLRAQGFSEADAKAEVARRVGTIRRQVANAMPELAAQEQQGLEDVAGAAESNGVWRSGQRLVDQQRLSDGINRKRNTITGDAADQEADAYGDLSRRVADLRRQTAEQSLNTRNALATQAAQGGLR